jgi:uncharacterized membrane protein YjjB (DUF3815 family)
MDFPAILLLSCSLGAIQVLLVPRSSQVSNVFEVSACVVIAFASRALGSIATPLSLHSYRPGHSLFCFPGVAQSSIVLILPGFPLVNAAMELQSKNLVSGSVRLVYAIIYVLFIAFGLLIGTTLSGLMKHDAVEDVVCDVPPYFTLHAGVYDYTLLYTRFIWPPMFACGVGIVYRAKFRQLPMMAFLATLGHQVTYWISTRLASNVHVAGAIGSFAIGCAANVYSRFFNGLAAAAAMLPAIFVQVPGGLAASGSLVADVASSRQMLTNDSHVSVVTNGTQGFVAAEQDPDSVYGGTVLEMGYGMVQIAVGISVGLFMASLVVYPRGMKKYGLFSF